MMFTQKKFNLGDEVYIYIGNHQGGRSRGTVAHVFSLDGWCIPEFYVIELPTAVDPLLEVRDGFSCWHEPSELHRDEPLSWTDRLKFLWAGTLHGLRR